MTETDKTTTTADSTDTQAGSTPTTTDAAVTLADRQAADLRAEREAQAKAGSKEDLAYLNQGIKTPEKVTPTTFGDGKDDQPPGGHPADPTSKGSVGSTKEL